MRVNGERFVQRGSRFDRQIQLHRNHCKKEMDLAIPGRNVTRVAQIPQGTFVIVGQLGQPGELNQVGGVCRVKDCNAFQRTACLRCLMLLFVGNGEQTKTFEQRGVPCIKRLDDCDDNRSRCRFLPCRAKCKKVFLG